MSTGENNSKRDQEIDENLKRVYQRTLEEDVPERFKELMEKLKKQDSSDEGDQ